MAVSNTYIDLPNGRKIPCLGLGTFQSEYFRFDESGQVVIKMDPSRSKLGAVRKAVGTAISCGYRHIDGAFLYQCEIDVGKGIKDKIEDGTVRREDLFVTSKLWLTYTHPDDVEAGCRQSLTDLDLNYIDLYLIHWPMTCTKTKGIFPLADDGTMIASEEDHDFVDTWKAMENLVDMGLVRAIGLSNFTVSQIQRIQDLPPKHPISMLQIESHPYFLNTECLDFCKMTGIPVTTYSPLGAPARPQTWNSPEEAVLLDDPVVREVAESRGVTPAQVLISFQLHRGLVTIPKSVTPSRIEQNFQALNVQLSEDDVTRLQGLERNFRCYTLPQAAHLKNYPFATDI